MAKDGYYFFRQYSNDWDIVQINDNMVVFFGGDEEELEEMEKDSYQLVAIPKSAFPNMPDFYTKPTPKPPEPFDSTPMNMVEKSREIQRKLNEKDKK